MLIFNSLAIGIGIIGILIIVWGILMIIIEFVHLEYTKLSTKKSKQDKNQIRRHLGSYILLGLEFMVAGDIIHTILKPDQQALIVLGSIVAIRTVISYFLHLEMRAKD